MSSNIVTLSQAKALVKALASEQSLLLLSAPGIGKSETVAQAAKEAGLPLRSLLGTQIAPEDVSGIPRIVGERSVFCPPRILLPEKPEPFCLFLDELPATSPDIQKAFYSLLLERRIGEYELPKGTWVVAAGNRMEDQALVRSLSSALVNRVCLLQVKVDHQEWYTWARENQIRSEVLSFLLFMPEALMRETPRVPAPFSTPRSWTLLSRALDKVESAGLLSDSVRRALAFGRVSAKDAAVFCAVTESGMVELRALEDYLNDPKLLPSTDTGRWFVLSRLRYAVEQGVFPEVKTDVLNRFLMSLPREHRFSLFVDLVAAWGGLGAERAMLDSLKELTGL